MKDPDPPDPVDAAVARFRADGSTGDPAADALFTRLALVTGSPSGSSP